jgi:hypothetical protein
VVATEDALAAALSLGGWDVVLTDASDIATIQDRLVATGTHLLPVLSTGEPANAPQLRRFARIIKAPKKADAFVEAIDRTLVLEAGAARPAGFRH